MVRITIVGKNSELYRWIRPQLMIDDFEVIEVGHNELASHSVLYNPIVFAFTLNLSDNISLIRDIDSKRKGRFIYVSSTAVYAVGVSAKFLYPAIKKEIEQIVFGLADSSVVRIGIPEGLRDRRVYGLQKVTQRDMLLSSIKELLIDVSDSSVVDCWREVLYEENILFKFYSSAVRLYSISALFYPLRAVDMALKHLNYYDTGYTYISNQNSILKYDNVVIGDGLSALGVVERLLKLNNLKNTIVISAGKKHDSTPKSNVNDFVLEGGIGGNSGRWHGVISENTIKNDERFEHAFLNVYPERKLYFREGYSFIPLRPLRPRKKLSKFTRIREEKVLSIIRDTDQELRIITDINEYKSNFIHLCTGSFATLGILYNSNLLSKEKSGFQISDHMVGYFGQIQLNEKSRKLGIRRGKFGYWKRFDEIKLESGRSLFVSLRPAYAGFKNLKVASEYREVFSVSSGKVVSNIIKKFNFALILEAVFNKFGVVFFRTRTFNIVGHITVDNAYRYDPKIGVVKSEEVIVFSNAEKEELIKYFQNMYKVEQIHILSKVKVSPGMHYNSVDLDTKEVQVYSSLSLGNDRASHFSFDLYVRSLYEIR